MDIGTFLGHFWRRVHGEPDLLSESTGLQFYLSQCTLYNSSGSAHLPALYELIENAVLRDVDGKLLVSAADLTEVNLWMNPLPAQTNLVRC